MAYCRKPLSVIWDSFFHNLYIKKFLLLEIYGRIRKPREPKQDKILKDKRLKVFLGHFFDNRNIFLKMLIF